MRIQDRGRTMTLGAHSGSEELTLDERIEQMVLGYRILDMEGHSDMAQGFMGMRDPDGRGIWLKRTGISLGEVRGLEDFMLIDFDGRRIGGSGGLHGEWPILSQIFVRRPEVQAIGHTHPFHACVFAASTADFRAVGHEGSYLKGPIRRFTATSNIVVTKEMADIVASDLGDSQAVLMVNHGITYCGRSVAECVLAGVWLDQACRSLLAIHATGLQWTPPNQADHAEKYETIMATGFLDRSWNFYVRKLAAQSGEAPPGLAHTDGRQ